MSKDLTSQLHSSESGAPCPSDPSPAARILVQLVGCSGAGAEATAAPEVCVGERRRPRDVLRAGLKWILLQSI